MDLSRSLLAGLASGALMGVIFVGIAASAVIARPEAAARLATASFRGMSTVKSSTLGALATVVAGMLIGAIIGLVHFAVSAAIPAPGLGSPTAAYTVGIVALSFVIGLAAALWRRPYAWPALAASLSLAAVFGWLLPWLAY